MCGITGLFEHKKVNQKVLDAMTDSLAHRGPDDRGTFIDQNIGLGQRRLSILDLSLGGHQPMQTRHYVITYNGEIYNFKILRASLIKLGYRFKSQTDTEVVLYAFEEWGLAALNKFNGMWAFIIFDKRKKKLFACRDRLGIKPLYYFFDGRKLILASEIKAILAHPKVKVELDLQALNEYFSFQNIFSDRTLFLQIKLLPPGSFLEYDGRNLVVDKWWDVPLAKKNFSEKQWEEKINDVFTKAVKRHLISDVEIGSYLSGGMDSATVTALAAHENPRLKTFTGGFDMTTVKGLEATFDEREKAEVVAKMYSSEHYEMVMHSGSMNRIFPKLIWHLEDLRVGMCYPNYYISRLASKFVKVVLSGAGGDELFGGYAWRYALIKNAKNKSEFDQIYYDYWTRLVKDKEKNNFFHQDLAKKIDFSDSFLQYRDKIAKVDDLHPVDKALYFEMKTFLHGLLLVEDKVSMANSLEVRVPFLDLEMIDLACSIPYQYKINAEMGKVVLRKATREFLPPGITEKKKQGFSPPEGSWYRDESLPYVKSILLSPRTLGRGYINPKFIQNTIQEHVGGKQNHRLLIWSLLSFEWWCRVFLEGER